MSIQELYINFKACSAVITDTRNIVKDSMFFALKGPSFNANTFASNALDEGCKYAIIDEKEYFIDERTILVDNVLESLQKLACFHRKQISIPIIGITGSNGKTTTKELLNAVLSKKYKVSATLGNLNNHIGVPLTLLAIKGDTEIAIVEMGANHAGEIEFLCNISKPDHGLITNIGKAHLEGFGTIDIIIETKTALYSHLEKNKGIAFVNSHDDLLMEESSRNNRILYRDSSIDAAAISSSSPLLTFNLSVGEEIYNNLKSNLIGDYNLDNILAAMSIGLHFEVDIKDIINAIENYIPSNNRSQLLNTKSNKLILDAYNANPSSTLLALENFISLQLDNKVIILGDMLELGSLEEKEHQLIVDRLKHINIDVILIGPIYAFCELGEGIKSFSNTNDAFSYLEKNPLKNKTILIKGSRGLKLESLTEVL